MLTITKAAELLNVHPNTLRRWADQGKIRVYRINPRGDRRIKEEDIEKFLEDNTEPNCNIKKPAPILIVLLPVHSGLLCGLFYFPELKLGIL